MARNGKTRAGSRSNCSSTMSPVDGGSRGVSDRPGGGEAGSGGYRMWWFALVTLSTLVARPVWAAGEVKPEETAAAEQSPKFSSAQIEQLVAPIALYPDGLAVQVLMASTYPLEIVEAARWRAKNASLQGDALDQALESRNWDPSVESLTHFPDLLERMSDNLDWTKDLGDAFLGQKDEVLDTVQRMRAKAYESGALKTTKEQVVTREVVKEKEIIRVEPADPQVVYVPQYSPEAVYGAPPTTPYYPAMYAYPPGYVATASLLSFGAGMAVGAAVWGDCDWNNGNVYNNYGGGGGGNNQNVNINKNKEKNVDRSRERTRGEGGRQKWEHNPGRRDGVRYRDQTSAKKYGGRDQVASRDRANRDAARGFDRGRSGDGRSSQRTGGRQEGASRPGGGRGQGGGGARPSPATRDRGGAFGGYESGRASREASARGAASRGGTSYAGGGGQRGGGSGGGGGRGGGFGGGGGRGGGGGGGGGGGRGGGRGGGGRGGRR